MAKAARKKKTTHAGPPAAKRSGKQVGAKKGKKAKATAASPSPKRRSKTAGARTTASGQGGANRVRAGSAATAAASEPPRGFTLGDHTFLAPSQPSDVFARWNAPKRQILGAPPPTCLEGLVREATSRSPAARTLRKGAWCGHGEPTLAVFDVVIDGQDLLEISFIEDPKDVNQEQNHIAIVVRTIGSQSWTPIFRREWEERQETLSGLAFRPLSAKEASAVRKKPLRGRVSIGFEYPCDADSRDSVSWMEVHGMPDGGTECHCVASAELA